MKKIFSVLIIILIIGAWGTLFYRNNTLPQEYSDALAKAEAAYEEGYYLEAQKLLAEAQSLQGASSSYKSDALQRDIYLGLNKKNQYESSLQKMIRQYPETEENYELLVKLYDENQDYKGLSGCLEDYVTLWPENKVIRQIDEAYSKLYQYRETGYYDVKYISSSLIDVQRMEFELGNGDVPEVRRELLDAEGFTVFDAGTQAISVSEDGNNYFICDQEGKWTLVDSSLNLIAKNDEVSFETIGRLGTNGVAMAVINGEKHYINERMLVNDRVWEDCCDFSEGIAAVKKNGRWALVRAGEVASVEEFPYLDVAINDEGYCIKNGLAVVKDESGYYVLDVESGKPSFENRFEELKALNSGQPIAYRKGQKWGFAYTNGAIMTEAMYEDARSYVNGYAAVKQNGLWGIIDKNNLMVVEPQFQDMIDVLDSGYVYVRNQEGYWDQIILERLKNRK